MVLKATFVALSASSPFDARKSSPWMKKQERIMIEGTYELVERLLDPRERERER
jgi:hypothetical protein